ncbi:UbiD family decarboxylase [Archaeoglobus fulgidus]|uniref:UbiD family decarboxylase n=1 Tax=Archaeoglobus fulgidus TaxID=2234 RepID=UPI000B357CDD|nr:UbiD family decarboxylase [Archaeoglobus fulgidus]
MGIKTQKNFICLKRTFSMNLRDAISVANPVQLEEEIKHDEVVSFLKSKNLLDKPVILNVEGKKVAKNFVSSRETLGKYLSVDAYSIARELSKIEDREAEIRVEPFSSLAMKKVDVNLQELPVIKYFPRDGGRYITAGIVIAQRNGVYNASIHRMLLLDESRVAARLVPPRHTYLMWREAVEREEELEVAVVIGTHPLFLFASATRVPSGKEFSYAAGLMGRLTLYRKGEMLVPDSEIILFGRITAETAKEGPFVDITGTYDIVRDEPVIVFDEMYVKEDYIYYSITPAGKEHQMLMGVPYEPVIYRFVSNVCKVKNVITTPGSCHYFHCVVQIEKKSEGDGKNAIIAALAANPSMKGVVVVDDDIDILSYEDMEFAIATRFQPDRDLVVVKGARGSSLDPSADKTTSKWGIDATKPLGKEGFDRVV